MPTDLAVIESRVSDQIPYLDGEPLFFDLILSDLALYVQDLERAGYDLDEALAQALSDWCAADSDFM